MRMALPTYWREAASVIVVGRTNQLNRVTKADSKVLMMKRSEKVNDFKYQSFKRTYCVDVTKENKMIKIVKLKRGRSHTK